jgi:HD-GYP domain-containing protein (c-di-GMP phosphodiesterase class II)
MVSHDENSGIITEMIPVGVDTLRHANLEVDLYLQRRDTDAMILYRGGAHPVSSEDLDRLSNRGIDTLYMATRDDGALRRQVADEVRKRDVPVEQRLKLLTDVNRAVFNAVFEKGTTDELLDFTRDFAGCLTDVICTERVILADLFQLMEHDDYTYTHCLNVCTFTLVLANALGVTNLSELASVGAGALLHDIGKRNIDRAILAAPTTLTQDQRHRVEQHPQLGFQELFQRDDVGWGELMMVYQHHERIDGEGYPVRLMGDEIHPWARICTIADIFHALTSERPYRKPMSISEACDYLSEQAGSLVDADMVKCWAKKVVAEKS